MAQASRLCACGDAGRTRLVRISKWKEFIGKPAISLRLQRNYPFDLNLALGEPRHAGGLRLKAQITYFPTGLGEGARARALGPLPQNL